MFRRATFAVALSVLSVSVVATMAAPPQEAERRKVPKDSVEVTVDGCLKGRVLKASAVRETDVQSGPNVSGRAFRLAGPKDLMNIVKENDGQRVKVVGLIKRSALDDPGMKFKGGRVVVGGGTMSGGPHGIPDPAENTVVLDMSAVQTVGGSCR